MITTDTIIAVSSPPGRGARGIIRLSGENSHRLLMRAADIRSPVLSEFWLPARLRSLNSPAGLIFFVAPRSFTGQMMAEIHLPGSPVLLHIVITELLLAGARMAEPGEFTARAFLSGKFDLTRAEGIAATIAARNRRQLRAAEGLRTGELFRWTHHMADQLAELLALVEASIDFTEEPDISFISDAALHRQIAELTEQISSLIESAARWENLDSPPSVVMLGRPNAGKSSLLNALSRQDRAIVSGLAGTTRDAIAVNISHQDRSFRLVDAAGCGDETAPLAIPMDLARERALETADVILLVTAPPENSALWARQLAAAATKYHTPVILVKNKCDLPEFSGEDTLHLEAPAISVSARTGQNLDKLQDLITKAISQGPMPTRGHIALNARHRAALHQALNAMRGAEKLSTTTAAHTMPELLAGELRLALQSLGEISGAISPDELLGKIFSRFCIGK